MVGCVGEAVWLTRRGRGEVGIAGVINFRGGEALGVFDATFWKM